MNWMCDNVKEYLKKSIEIIQEYEPMALRLDPRGYCVASSFGKDSVALIEVFRMAKVKFFIQWNVTGIDPPELTYFAREQVKRLADLGINTHIVYPRISMMRLIEKKGMPPTRLMRYCCTELKERKVPETKGCFFSFGVRKAESVARSKRGTLEVVTSDPKKRVIADIDLSDDKQQMIMLFNDNDEKRKMFENCVIKGVRAINPILYWDDNELWEFIREYNVPYCKLYDEGYKRLGCLLCPIANKKARYDEAEKYPKFKQYYLKAFDLMLKKRIADGKSADTWKTAQDVYNWWISN